MATTKAKSTSTKKKTTTQTAKAKTKPVVEKKTPKADSPPAKKKLTLADVSLNELVEVQSCYYGNLIYVSSKTNAKTKWSEFGVSEYMPVEEVMVMRNSQPAFFRNQWVRLVGDNAEDVMNFLQLQRYYPKATQFDDFEEIFDKTPAKIKEIVSEFTDSMKESFARYAHSLVQSGEIDSIKKIEAIEDATGFDLRE